MLLRVFQLTWGLLLYSLSNRLQSLLGLASAAITQGTAVSTVQLDATANVPGRFTYSPVLGTVLPAGTSTLTANFTPTDTTDYTRNKTMMRFAPPLGSIWVIFAVEHLVVERARVAQ